MSRIIVGLAGFRKTGKSLIAEHLCRDHGFKSVHPFRIWKDVIKDFYMKIGIGEEEAENMVHGHLKDMPHPLLPDNADSRYLMEKLGKFAGTGLSPEWTLGFSLQQAKREYPDANLVIESLVYEVDLARQHGGHIIMVERPGTEGTGLETDKFTKIITSDSTFINDGNDPEQMISDFDDHMARHNLMPRRDSMEFGQ